MINLTNNQDLKNRLLQRQSRPDLSGGNPVIQGVAGAIGRFGKNLVSPGSASKSEDDLATKLQYSLLENQLKKDPLDDQLKQERIKALQAGLTTDESGNIIKRPPAPKPMSSYGVADDDTRTPEEIYQNLNPENKALLDSVDKYDTNPMSIPGMNNQARTELLKLETARNPSYQQANYATKASTLKDFSSGKSADQVQALNTAAKHSGRIQENMDSLHNMSGILAPLNGPKNFILDKVGGGGPKTAALSINATFDELATALKKSGATDQTISGLKQRINENMSPEAQKSVLADIANLLSDQESSLQSRYKEGTFKEHNGPFFDKYGQDVIGRLKGGKAPAFAGSGNSNQPPPGAAHFSPSTGKYYDEQGNEL